MKGVESTSAWQLTVINKTVAVMSGCCCYDRRWWQRNGSSGCKLSKITAQQGRGYKQCLNARMPVDNVPYHTVYCTILTSGATRRYSKRVGQSGGLMTGQGKEGL